MTNLLSPGALRRLIDDANGPAVRLLDVRWRLDKPDGRAAYLEGHLPGAVYVDLDRQLARQASLAKVGILCRAWLTFRRPCARGESTTGTSSSRMTT